MLALLGRPLARVLDRQRGGDDHDLARDAARDRPRRSSARAAGPSAAGRGAVPVSVEARRRPIAQRADSVEQLHAVAHRARCPAGRRTGSRRCPRASPRRRPRSSAGSRTRATCAGSPARCTSAARRSRPASTAGSRCRPRHAAPARALVAPTPARSARWAAAAPWSPWSTARCARCRGRSRTGCPARSARSRRRWSRARPPAVLVPLEHPVLLGGGQPAVEGQELDGARVRGSATRDQRACAGRPPRRGSPARRRGTRGCRPGPPAASSSTASRSRVIGSRSSASRSFAVRTSPRRPGTAAGSGSRPGTCGR